MGRLLQQFETVDNAVPLHFQGGLTMKKCLKRIVGIATLVFAIMLLIPSFSLSARTPRIRVDGEFVQIPHGDQPPIIVDGRTLVPLRAVMEALGFYVNWESAPINRVRLAKQAVEISATIGSDVMYVDGETIALDVPAQIINNRTMIPVRAVSEATGMFVRWDSANLVVDIFTGNNPQIWSSPSTWPINSTNWPEHLPQHVPGAITLHPEEQFGSLIDLRYPMQFRYRFYGISGFFLDLVPSEERRNWSSTVQQVGEPYEVMLLMRFVEDFNITREDFDAAVYRMREVHEDWAMRGIIVSVK